jgi:predicted transcriptional regulator
VDSTPAEIALLSIHPRFAEAILSGEKLVEFRRTRFSRRVSHIVIYATKPVGMVVGWFEVEGIESRHPDELWGKFRHCGGIAESDFRAYYSGRSTGHAIRVRTPWRLPKAAPLKAVCRDLRPPQSFAYLRPGSARRLFSLPTR